MNIKAEAFKQGVRAAQEDINRLKAKLPTADEIAHLEWIYMRLAAVYDECQYLDYMVKFKEIIKKLKA